MDSVFVFLYLRSSLFSLTLALRLRSILTFTALALLLLLAAACLSSSRCFDLYASHPLGQVTTEWEKRRSSICQARVREERGHKGIVRARSSRLRAERKVKLAHSGEKVREEENDCKYEADGGRWNSKQMKAHVRRQILPDHNQLSPLCLCVHLFCPLFIEWQEDGRRRICAHIHTGQAKSVQYVFGRLLPVAADRCCTRRPSLSLEADSLTSTVVCFHPMTNNIPPTPVFACTQSVMKVHH
jgi:hypothetical protein